MLKNKKLLLVPLVLSSEAVYAGSTSGVKSALSNYCVPYSDTYKETNGKYYGQVYNAPVCSSVFESIYKLNGNTPKCDCYENAYPNHSDAYPEAGKFLQYNTTSRRCEPTCPNRYKIKELSGCPTGTYQDKITKTDKSESVKKYVQCEPCTKPANSDWAVNTGCDWECSSGFTQIGSSLCCSKPANSTWNSGASNCSAWSCNLGYYKSGNSCAACSKPANSSYTQRGSCSWTCNTGFWQNDNKCYEVIDDFKLKSSVPDKIDSISKIISNLIKSRNDFNHIHLPQAYGWMYTTKSGTGNHIFTCPATTTTISKWSIDNEGLTFENPSGVMLHGAVHGWQSFDYFYYGGYNIELQGLEVLAGHMICNNSICTHKCKYGLTRYR